MKDKIIQLECDDVILLGKNAFQVSRFKELLHQQIQCNLQQYVHEYNNSETGFSILDLLNLISLKQHNLILSEIQHHYVTNCQILKVYSQGWQTGKLKIEIRISTLQSHLNQIDFEFYPDESTEYESLLEDISKILSDNQS
ncbi:MAG: KGK domain-containing protein [Nostocaceae cyanobacterium]|nr:KGK domain-containing protein [Nostocaceae cyanobacterium]